MFPVLPPRHRFFAGAETFCMPCNSCSLAKSSMLDQLISSDGFNWWVTRVTQFPIPRFITRCKTSVILQEMTYGCFLFNGQHNENSVVEKKGVKEIYILPRQIPRRDLLNLSQICHLGRARLYIEIPITPRRDWRVFITV